jgi:ferredoxin
VAQTRVLSCSCNGTVPVESARLGQSAEMQSLAVEPVARELCRREVGRFVDALSSDERLLVTCTQEAALFEELASARQTVAPIRFVNVRERAGWGDQGASAGPKIAALVAMAAAADPEPVPGVGYRSQGRALVLGKGRDALAWGERLSQALSVTVLITRRDGSALPVDRRFVVLSGRLASLSGWLGAFEARWEQDNPVDLDACVRCGACVSACPEQAIDEDFQVDLQRCAGHRKCVAACGEVGAIDFSRAERGRSERFDLVLDLGDVPSFSQHDRPPGYLFPGEDESARIAAAMQLSRMVGEFEKPKFFRYNERTCARGRNRIEGCRQCHDVCSTSAIELLEDRIRVEPSLCQGCGACTSVCPSGALTYAYPSAVELGRRLRVGLKAYASRGGTDALVLFHDGERGRMLLDEVGRGPLLRGPGPAKAAPGVRGLPARVVPVEVHHMASVGIDLALAALAFGACQVAVLSTGAEAPQYAQAIQGQFEVAQRIVAALGYAGRHLLVLSARNGAELERELHALVPGAGVDVPAAFAMSEEKRRSIEFAVDHLLSRASAQGRFAPQFVPLPANAPFGSLNVDRERCTLCLACVGACPEAALLDNQDVPQLRFIERNCVQCGLCERTCPEKAISLEPRYGLTEEVRSTRVLNEAQPFNCVACGKPFGTRQMVDSMVAKLSGHSMFGGDSARRLQMCADCRVVDMFSRPDEKTIFDVQGGH